MPDTTPGREDDLASRAFVDLADTLGDDFDPTAHLRMFACRCAELLAVSAAAATVFDEAGELQAAAASCREARSTTPGSAASAGITQRLFARQDENPPGPGPADSPADRVRRRRHTPDLDGPHPLCPPGAYDHLEQAADHAIGVFARPPRTGGPS
jgi:hypothetical protein